MKKKDVRKELTDIYGINDVINCTSTEKIVSKTTKGAVKPVTSTNSTPDSWEQIQSQLDNCTRCKLCKERKNIVFGEGNRNADLMFVGEGPGAQEDESGRPFVGRAGQLLTKMIGAMGYEREDVFIGNIVKCRPPDNRKPFKDEMDACVGFLQRQIHLIKPKVIVCLGDTATVGLLNTTERISQLRGNFLDYNGIKAMPTFHPAYLLRNESAKKDVWEDLKIVMAELK